MFVGFSYQYFDFDTLDGLSLKKLPFVFAHQDDTVDNPGTTCSINPPDTLANEGNPGPQGGSCSFVRDVVKTIDRIDLKIHQFTAFVDFGITDRIEVSAAVPIETVRMAVFSTATIVDNSHSGDHEFQCSTPPCLSQSFPSSPNAKNVTGIGDVTFRVKGTIWRGERNAVAVGADVRVPTGDELDFLGSGAIGVHPFAVWSYRSRISPHFILGYASNASSVLAGDVSTGRKARLPSEVTYSGGIDVWVTTRLTAAVDLVGEQVHQARRIAATTFTELGACNTNKDPMCDMTDASTFLPGHEDLNTSQFVGSYNITNAAIGIKAKPFANLVITANVTLKLNDGGLRAKAIPLVGLSYTF